MLIGTARAQSGYPKPVKLIFREPSYTPRSSDNQVRLLHDGSVALPAMLEAIRAARHEVLIDMYWFSSDRTGMSFAEALMERARAGVCVRVIYDSVGSIGASTAMFSDMRKAGCDVYEWNPIAPWRARFSFARLNRRDHRKLVVVDGEVAITGGINLGNEWAPKHAGGAGFRDDSIEVRGTAAWDLRALFYRTFPKPPLEIPRPPSGSGTCEVVVLSNDLFAERRHIHSSYVGAISMAARDIIISNSYFIPSGRVRRALIKAVRRGVRVRVMVPRDSDVKMAQYASRALYERLLAAGVQIYEWRGGVLHSKVAVVDDNWCTVGSFNFDALSVQNNLELNVAMLDHQVTRDLRRKLEEDLTGADLVDLGRFRERGAMQRAIERFFYFFRWLL